MKPVSIIVAVAENQAIGCRNELLCHLPADLKYFKRITSGHTVVMGKRTWASLPVRPLPGRRNIVITDISGELFEGAETVYSIEEALAHCDAEKESFIIGGGSVYRQFMPHASKLYITHVHHHFDADTFFPEIDSEVWRLDSLEPQPADEQNPFPYSFAVYVRR
jgi:dihydrofolate reductase